MGKTERKSIWDIPAPETPGGEPATSGWGGNQPQPASQLPAAVPIIEQLRLVEKKQRDRSWEKKEGNRPTSYRGVPVRLQAEIRQVAVELQVTVDDVARAFLEFGLQCYRQGELKITPTLRRQRLTLFPAPDHWTGVRRPGWYECDRDRPVPKPTRCKKSTHKSDEQAETPWKWPKASYRRLPGDLVETIRQLHEKHSIPVGEIVTLFLVYALDAYQSGRLILEPQPRTSASLAYSSK
jgi:hypothetical protein